MWPWMAAFAMLLASAGAAMADCNHPAAINFAPGAASATIVSDDPVPTAECYQVTAQVKRELGMFLESTEKGPVLEVYAPGWTASCNASDECSISGTLMSDPGETEWTDTLTETGAYLIVVDNAHGDEYRLTVEIHLPGADRQ
jgi:hypothetical protein